VRSILKKTIYDVANPSQFPSLKRYKNPNPAVYVPAEPEIEILITQNPASSTVGVSNSVSLVPSSLTVSPLCYCFSPYCIMPDAHTNDAHSFVTISAVSGLPEYN